MVRQINNFDDDDAINFDDDVVEVNTLGSSKFNVEGKNGVLYYNNKRYAAGLIWLSDGDDDDGEPSAKKAKEFAADFTCKRAFVNQTGYGYLDHGHRTGMPSIAALAADALVGEWHGVFEADNGWLYLAAHADNIAPNGDVLFYSEQEAYNHFLAESEKFRWPKSYSPESWNIKTNDGPISLDKIIDGGINTSLRPVNLDAVFAGRSNKILFFIFASIIIASFLVYFLFKPFVGSFVPEPTIVSDNQSDDNIPDTLQVPEKLEPLPEDGLNPLVASIPLLPDPSVFLKLCVESFDDVTLSIPGWILGAMRCNETTVELAWVKDTGDLKTLTESVKKFPADVSKIYASNNQFLASKSFAYEDGVMKKPTLIRQEDLLILLNERFGRLGGLQVSITVPPPVMSNQNNGIQAVQPPSGLDVILTTAVSPLNLKEKFNLPGLKLNMVEWLVQEGTWTYNAHIYFDSQNSKDALR